MTQPPATFLIVWTPNVGAGNRSSMGQNKIRLIIHDTDIPAGASYATARDVALHLIMTASGLEASEIAIQNWGAWVDWVNAVLAWRTRPAVT